MDNKDIHLLLIWWIEEYKKLGNIRGYNYTTIKIDYDEQSIPIHRFFFNRRNAPVYKENYAETVLELNPSIEKYIETLSYNEKEELSVKINEIIPNYMLRSKGFKEFKNIVFNEKVYFEVNQDDDDLFYLLENIFQSILQEYSDLKGGILNILKKDLDHGVLNKLLNKYLMNIRKRSCDVEIIIPILGLKWIKENHAHLYEELEDNITIRLITKDEQSARSFHANTELGIFSFQDYCENESNIYRSNLIISIKEKISLKNLMSHENIAINEIYEKYHLKVNTLLNILYLENKECDLEVSDIYFKCDGYAYNCHGLPKSSWIRIETIPRNKIKLLNYRRLYNPNKIKKEELLNVIFRYKKILNASSINADRIQGAFLRRTRAQMDLNETEGLLDSIIGIEQLLSGNGQNTELSFRTSLYVCNILYNCEYFENKSKKEIFKEFNKLYGIRSSFVHHGKKVKNERALFYLSSLLREIIDSDKINLNLDKLISEQIQDIYLFFEG